MASLRKDDRASRRNLVVPVIVIGFILMMIVAVIIKAGRGSKGQCAYDHANRRTTCKGKQLHTIPRDIPDSVVTLHMGTKLDKVENQFSVLARGNFTRFTHLQELRLVKCGVEELRPDTFADVQSLRRLDLRYNRIQTISEETFRGLTILEYLYLSNNPLQSLGNFVFRGLSVENLVFANNPALTEIAPRAFTGSVLKTLVINRCNLKTIKSETFSYVTESLQELFITHNMQMLELPGDVFKGLKLQKLSVANNDLEEAEFLEHVIAEEINIDDNPLEEIDFDDSPLLKHTKKLSLSKTKLTKISKENLSMLTDLEELDLEGNDITILNATVFEDMDQLNILDLANNDLAEFDGDFANELQELDFLYLDGNEIQIIPQSLLPLFSRLKNLTLHDNPLHCNCELRWFVKWIEKHRDILQQVDTVRCKTPEPRNLTHISDYGFQCRPPTIFNATFDSDGLSLVCTADGDPAPKVSWMSPEGDKPTKVTLPSRFDRESFQTRSLLTISRDGNYTCIAENIAGTDSVVVNTRKMPSAGIKFAYESKEIEILETPQGFAITVFFICLLGYIIRVDSLKDLENPYREGSTLQK